ncbi:hypothetical protein VN97_g9279 [Penicillium thymicola]|uniref:Uncharacterized protein n=1 Tax=Penicillium thymicola TaxID=293382 RepID=A0AAI9TB53_PENTH|nr:hypothetical protein VN97_g9279 [Penicillium thymicola]
MHITSPRSCVGTLKPTAQATQNAVFRYAPMKCWLCVSLAVRYIPALLNYFVVTYNQSYYSTGAKLD